MGSHEVQFRTIHGHRRAFVMAGEGPALLLVHGLACDHTTWLPVIDALAERHTVIVPDLLGHGQSAKPRADYSVGGFANGMRDLLTVLGIDQVTVVGHSFGGGVAMQFAYQFPERTERLALVSSGGLGPEVTPLLRAITLPGFDQAMAVATLPGVQHAGLFALRTLAKVGATFGGPARDLGEVADIYERFGDRASLAATRHVTRAVIDWRGQIVTMADRAYLTAAMPMLVVWGRDDLAIPVQHAENAARLAPQARVEVLENSGHFPHKDHPERFAEILTDFVQSTRSARYSRAMWRRHLASGPVQPANRALAGEAPVAPVAPVRARRSA